MAGGEFSATFLKIGLYRGATFLFQNVSFFEKISLSSPRSEYWCIACSPIHPSVALRSVAKMKLRLFSVYGRTWSQIHVLKSCNAEGKGEDRSWILTDSETLLAFPISVLSCLRTTSTRVTAGLVPGAASRYREVKRDLEK